MDKYNKFDFYENECKIFVYLKQLILYKLGNKQYSKGMLIWLLELKLYCATVVF